MKLGSFHVGLCPIVGTKHGTSFRIGPKFLGIQQEDFKEGKAIKRAAALAFGLKERGQPFRGFSTRSK